MSVWLFITKFSLSKLFITHISLGRTCSLAYYFVYLFIVWSLYSGRVPGGILVDEVRIHPAFMHIEFFHEWDQHLTSKTS